MKRAAIREICFVNMDIHALRRQRAVCLRLIVRGKRLSAVAALSINGILDFSNKVDGDYFYNT